MVIVFVGAEAARAVDEDALVGCDYYLLECLVQLWGFCMDSGQTKGAQRRAAEELDRSLPSSFDKYLGHVYG